MNLKIKNALVSVSDKDNLISLLKIFMKIFNTVIKLSLSETDTQAFLIFKFIIKFFF